MTAGALTAAQQAAVQRRTVLVLSTGQVLGGIAFGATVSLGALLAADLSGSDALSGLATASVTLGAAVCAIPLARLAARVGRRRALTLGNLFALVGIAVVILAASLRVFPLLLVGILMIGAGNAGNLQSRFAATDLAAPQHRGRDLSIVVWATTIGGVAGPLLLGPGEIVGAAISCSIWSRCDRIRSSRRKDSRERQPPRPVRPSRIVRSSHGTPSSPWQDRTS